jgi:2-polyprenyl-3-methyl-5-hydroxy-6-metoxy-1,4-benzoquinol methylase
MPLYKYFGNKILTFLQNRIVGTTLSEYHSGYRLYRCDALSKIPFELNSNGFEFDTEIIIQFHRANLNIVELPIPTFYGDEICYVQGVPYAGKVLAISLNSRLQNLGIKYDPKFDVAIATPTYQSKFSFESSHSFALEEVSPGENLLIIGCGPLATIQPFIEKGCTVTLVDKQISVEQRVIAHSAFEGNLDDCNLQKYFQEPIDCVLLCDVLEHLQDPEAFLKKLRTFMDSQNSRIIISTPNIAFAIIRISLLFGQFNYGPRGILDLTHKRLFTFGSLRRILMHQGFSILKIRGVPAPFQLALGLKSSFAKILLALNSLAIILSKKLFSYQVFVVAKPNPTVSQMLSITIRHTDDTIKNFNDIQNKK